MIFISYRRDDTAGYARALAAALAQRYGAGRVFIDVDDIAAGAPFADVIGRAVGGSQVLLVLIGPRWRGPLAGGDDRLADPGDFVRREVEAGLAGGLRVIPLLLDGAAMPAAESLPPSMQALAARNAMRIDAAAFDADVARLVAALGPPPAGPRRAALWAGGGLLLATVGGGAAWWLRRPAAGPVRPAINGDWEAAVTYGWPNANYTERLRLGGEGTAVEGSASFLRVARPIAEGRVDADGLQFVTRTTEVLGSTERTLTHRYRARLVGDELQVTMQTEGGAALAAPVAFTARRLAKPG